MPKYMRYDDDSGCRSRMGACYAGAPLDGNELERRTAPSWGLPEDDGEAKAAALQTPIALLPSLIIAGAAATAASAR